MPISDPFEEKSQHFFPRERYFWVLDTLGWIFTLTLLNPGYVLLNSPNAEQLRFLGVYLAAIWLAYFMLGTLSLLIFRRYYYRQRWYQKQFAGSLPLVILVALGGGMAIAVLVVLPLNLLLDTEFSMYDNAGSVVYAGIFSTTVFAGSELAFVLLFWLLAYLGIEGAINTRNLALKALALENSLKDARLNALAGQINPHFLFNALNNIRFMIQRDAARAEDGLVDLAEILRHSLGMSQQDKVPLAQELIIVESYLSLMLIQMQSRLAYSIQAAGVPDKVLVPPMIVKMLVENAIKHGVEQIKEGGRVDVRCSLNATTLRIDVSNTAVNVESGTADKELTIVGADTSSKGVGLANIRNRLSLLYGASAGLSMSRQQGKFVVRIELPSEEAA